MPEIVRTLRLVAPIGDHGPVIDPAEVVRALFPDQMSADSVLIDLQGVFANGDPQAWPRALTAMAEGCRRATARAADGSMPPLALFGFAPIPLLMALGRLLGDKSRGRIFERHRHTDSWNWDPPPGEDLGWQVVRPEHRGRSAEVGVLLSVSGRIDPQTVRQTFVEPRPLYELLVDRPAPNIVRTELQLGQFVAAWRRLLEIIRSDHGPGGGRPPLPGRAAVRGPGERPASAAHA